MGYQSMKMSRLDNCANCEKSMTLHARNEQDVLRCDHCGYEQLKETKERLESIADFLCTELYGWGVDKILIKDEEIDLEIALKADAVLPLIVDHYISQAGADNDLPYKVVHDERSLLKYRVIYHGNSKSTKPDEYKLLGVLSDLYTETRERNPEYERYINVNILLEDDLDMEKEDENSLAEEKFPIVLSMVEDRIEASQLGLFKTLKNEGVDLIKIDCVSTIKDKLNNEFPWFEKVTEIIFSQLSVRVQGDKVFCLTPILLLGDPGIGKTAYCSRLAELSKVPYRMLGLAGTSSNHILAGTERGWSTAKSSLVVQTILDHKIGNPLIILDELDKAGGSEHNGHPVQTLLGLLEPSSSKNWLDPFLMGHVDLSYVSWVATANDISQLPKTLLSRMRVINVESPQKEHYPAIINRTRHTFAKDNGIDVRLIPQFSEVEWNWIEQYYKTPRMARKATEVLVRNMVLGGPGQVIH